MAANASHSPVTWLLSYPIASADTYSTVIGQRDVYASGDPVHGFRIWGEILGQAPGTAIGLCEILVEHAMSCDALGDLSMAECNMETFGARIGEALAVYIRDSLPAEKPARLGAWALECVLTAMNARYRVEAVADELHYALEYCPLWATAERTGLGQYVELAHMGVRGVCQGLVHSIDPALTVRTPADASAEHIFLLLVPADAEMIPAAP